MESSGNLHISIAHVQRVTAAMLTLALGLLRRVPAWAAVLALLLAWGGWQRHTAKRETARAAAATLAAQQNAAAASAAADAREREFSAAEAARRAADAYSANLRRATAAAAAARTERDRMLLAADGAAAAGAACAPAGAASRGDGAAQLRVVVGECSAALLEVGQAADQCDANLRALQAWAREVPAVCR